jgi:hypothetical protein
MSLTIEASSALCFAMCSLRSKNLHLVRVGAEAEKRNDFNISRCDGATSVSEYAALVIRCVPSNVSCFSHVPPCENELESYE